MYYDRTLTSGFSKLIEPGGSLRWLYDFVKSSDDLDFQIGKSGSIGTNGTAGKKEWISVYRGLTRIIAIGPTRKSTIIKIDGAQSYKDMMPDLYGKKDINWNFQSEIIQLISKINTISAFDRYYNNRKEGFYQNVLSREYGISGNANTDFVIIDKEAVVGYANQQEKDGLFKSIQDRYKGLQKLISATDSSRFGKDLQKKAIGNELDFLAIDKDGNILLIEYKHGINTSGIYLSPLQIGLYYDIFTSLPRIDLDKAVYSMLNQKQKMGLINPNWQNPPKLKQIIPYLIISEHNYDSVAKINFKEILEISRKQLGVSFLEDLRKFNFTMKNGLVPW